MKFLKNTIWLVALALLIASCTKDEELLNPASGQVMEVRTTTAESDSEADLPSGLTQHDHMNLGDNKSGDGEDVDDDGNGITDDDDDEDDDDDGSAKTTKN